jgi:hypothetical protein
MFKVNIFLVFLLVGCIWKTNSDTNTSEQQTHSKYFSDIDLIRMKGINEMSLGDSDGPYVRIDSIDRNQRVIIFHFDNKTIYERNYVYDGHCWASSHYVDDPKEGAIFYFYEFIHGDSITSLEYRGDPFEGGTLQSVKKMTYGQTWEYVPENDTLQFDPNCDIQIRNLGKIMIKRISTYKIEDGILSFHKKVIQAGTDMAVRESYDCYVIGKHSYFWWRFAGHRFKKIEC